MSISNKFALAGLYRMDIAGHVYYGETVNIPRRRLQHWKELTTKRHHCILLRRLVCAYGLDAVTFSVISQGPQWSDATVRRAAELKLRLGDENSLNSAGQLGTYASHLRLPDKPKYRSRELYLRFARGVVEAFDGRGGKLVGIERARGKVATGHYIVDERSYINAAPNVRRAGGRLARPPKVRADRVGT